MFEGVTVRIDAYACVVIELSICCPIEHNSNSQLAPSIIQLMASINDFGFWNEINTSFHDKIDS